MFSGFRVRIDLSRLAKFDEKRFSNEILNANLWAYFFDDSQLERFVGIK